MDAKLARDVLVALDEIVSRAVCSIAQTLKIHEVPKLLTTLSVAQRTITRPPMG